MNSEALDQIAQIYQLVWITFTKICLYNFDPLKRHFYIVKLGLTGVYIIFHISAQKTEIVGTR